MKYSVVITLLTAMCAAGCGDAQSDQAERTDQNESPKELSPDAVAAEAKRIIEAAAPKEEPKAPNSPGFFSGSSSRGRREDNRTTETTPTVTPTEPIKRPPPKLVKPNAETERQLRLAKLYIASAADAASAVRRKFLNDKAATILKDVISKSPQTPLATQASKLLAEIAAQ